jgi:hypothetical protein
MTERVLGPKESKRRRWTLLLPVVAAIALGLFYITGAQAVHDFGGLGEGGVFELDNNAIDDPTGGPPPVNAGDDWETLISGSPGNPAGSADDQTDVPTTDPVNDSNDDTFCGGTKEKDDIAAWKWCNNASSNDKNDLEDGYAALYTVPNTATGICPTPADPNALCAGDKILYVGADRFANNGDSGLGFMFLQTGLAGNTCPAPSTGCTFNDNANGDGTGGTPHHVNGDIYIVSQFTGGGQGVTVDFYVWQGGAGGAWVLDSSGVDCDASSPNDVACGTVFGDGERSTNTCVDAPWDYVTKFPGDSPCTVNDFAEGTFYEGGVNLTQRNIVGCFKTVLVDTSQSQNINESAQDFVMGPFEGCESGTVTTPQTGAGGSIPAGGLSIGTNARVDVRDQAVITVTGIDTFGGTVQFFLCGPLALDSTSNCATGGVQIGSPAAGETVTGTGGTATVNSDTATLTSAGRYCWRAVYSGDSGAGVPGSSDPTGPTDTSITECFKVNPVQPTLTTTAGPDVILGNTISDTANLSGTAKQPGTDGIGPGGTINATAGTQANAGGTITFSVKGPNNCNDSGLTVTGSPVTVNGDNASYGPVTALPTAVGTYTFVATYSGNSPNTLDAGPSGCPEGSEEVVVTGTASSASKQRWLPNDRITITGDTNLNGTLTVTLYSGDNCGATSGSAISGQQYTTTFTNATSPQVFQTSNTTFFVGTNPDGTAGGAAGAYSWLVHYDDSALTDPTDKCETSTVSPITD